MRQKSHWQQGQSLVEMTVITVVLILLLGGLFDLGRAFIILVAVENAAGEGALYGATHPECLQDPDGSRCPDAEGISVVSRVQEEGKPVINIDPGDIELYVGDVLLADNPTFSGGSVLRVDVTYTYSPITPVGFVLWGDTAEVTASARQHVMSPPRPGS